MTTRKDTFTKIEHEKFVCGLEKAYVKWHMKKQTGELRAYPPPNTETFPKQRKMVFMFYFSGLS